MAYYKLTGTYREMADTMGLAETIIPETKAGKAKEQLDKDIGRIKIHDKTSVEKMTDLLSGFFVEEEQQQQRSYVYSQGTLEGILFVKCFLSRLIQEQSDNPMDLDPEHPLNKLNLALGMEPNDPKHISKTFMDDDNKFHGFHAAQLEKRLFITHIDDAMAQGTGKDGDYGLNDRKVTMFVDERLYRELQFYAGIANKRLGKEKFRMPKIQEEIPVEDFRRVVLEDAGNLPAVAQVMNSSLVTDGICEAIPEREKQLKTQQESAKRNFWGFLVLGVGTAAGLAVSLAGVAGAFSTFFLAGGPIGAIVAGVVGVLALASLVVAVVSRYRQSKLANKAASLDAEKEKLETQQKPEQQTESEKNTTTMNPRRGQFRGLYEGDPDPKEERERQEDREAAAAEERIIRQEQRKRTPHIVTTNPPRPGGSSSDDE